MYSRIQLTWCMKGAEATHAWKTLGKCHQIKYQAKPSIHNLYRDVFRFISDTSKYGVKIRYIPIPYHRCHQIKYHAHARKMTPVSRLSFYKCGPMLDDGTYLIQYMRTTKCHEIFRPDQSRYRSLQSISFLEILHTCPSLTST